MKIRFNDSATNEVKVTNGDFRRVFRRAEEPFEVEPAHWPMLRQTGHFEEAKELKQLKQLPPPPPTTQTNGSANGNQ